MLAQSPERSHCRVYSQHNRGGAEVPKHGDSVSDFKFCFVYSIMIK